MDGESTEGDADSEGLEKRQGWRRVVCVVEPQGRMPNLSPACRAVFLSAGGMVIPAAAGAAVSPPLFQVWVVVTAACGLLGFSAALSALEAALFSLASEEIETLERQGRRGIISARALLAFRDETLMTLLVLDHVLSLAFVACVAVVLSHVGILAGQPLAWAAAATVFSAAAVVVLGEYCPRALGRRFRVPVVLALARPLVGLTVLVAPLRWMVLSLSNALLGLPSESLLEREIGSEEGMKTLIAASDPNGGLDGDERELINGVVEFGAARVGDIMTPRPEIHAESDETPHEEMLQRMRRCEFNRVLIYTGDLDRVRGILHVKNLLLNPDTDYREALRKPLVIPETKSLMDLLREFRRERVHLAVVCDEFGRTTGVVTMHDLLEEIVGELTDENRPAVETIRSDGPNAWLVSGRTDLEHLRDRLGLDLSGQSNRTISGYVTSRLERIPAEGDSIPVNNGWRLTVERMGVRRVALLRLEKLDPAPAEDTEETPL